jgi:hypothetical protein
MALAKIRAALKLVLINLLVMFLAVVLVEGLASTVLLILRILETRPYAEKLHTRYDPDLGWTNIPRTTVKNLYGPGLDVIINSQGFREDTDIADVEPAGKARVLCVGDSFTFGYGVRGDQTWCHDLSALEPHLETVNMGLGGYGIDQAYLWYKRDGGRLAHHLIILAFVTDDFRRMLRDRFVGYGKPKLEFQDGQLHVGNVPVPHRSYLFQTTEIYRSDFTELRSVQLVRRWVGKEPAAKPPVDAQYQHLMLMKLMEDLVRVTKERGSKLVLAYLPSSDDFFGDTTTDWFRAEIEADARQNEIVFVDLVSEFRHVPPSVVRDSFIMPGAIPYPGASGHYTAVGNRVIAELLFHRLVDTPGLFPHS